MDYFVVPAIRSKMLFARFVVTDSRHEILHFNFTVHPTAPWVIEQLRLAFPEETSTKFLIHDNDAIFPGKVLDTIEKLGIEPESVSLDRPWQNGLAAR